MKRIFIFTLIAVFAGVGYEVHGAEISNVEVKSGSVYARVDGKEKKLAGIYRNERDAPHVSPSLTFTEIYVKNLTSTISMTVTLGYRDGYNRQTNQDGPYKTKVVSLMPGEKYSFHNMTRKVSIAGVANVSSVP